MCTKLSMRLVAVKAAMAAGPKELTKVCRMVEDTEITLEQLAKEFPAQVVEAVRLLTHDPETDYFDYVRAIKGSPIAMKVKLVDLVHNMDASRFAGVEVPKERIGYFRDKYTKALAILLEE